VGDPLVCESRRSSSVGRATKFAVDNFLISNAHSGFRSAVPHGVSVEENRSDAETES